MPPPMHDNFGVSTGVLAPSSAFGLVLHDRLKAADFELSVENAPVSEEEPVKKVA